MRPTLSSYRSLNNFFTTDEKRGEIIHFPKVIISWVPDKQVRGCISVSIRQIFDRQNMCIACLRVPPQWLWFEARNGCAAHQKLQFVFSITLRNPSDICTFTEFHVIPSSFFFFCPLERVIGISALCRSVNAPYLYSSRI